MLLAVGGSFTDGFSEWHFAKTSLGGKLDRWNGETGNVPKKKKCES